ncbi:MAG: hypothetical protein ACI9M6_001509, partial [Hydrogenophaga sp.]
RAALLTVLETHHEVLARHHFHARQQQAVDLEDAAHLRLRFLRDSTATADTQRP